jgi:hypothetical protein
MNFTTSPLTSALHSVVTSHRFTISASRAVRARRE